MVHMQYIAHVHGVKNQIAHAHQIKDKLELFLKKFDLTAVNTSHHDFTPHGSTIVFILSASHLIIHTYPEKNYLHFDLAFCSERDISNKDIELAITEIFACTHLTVERIA